MAVFARLADRDFAYLTTTGRRTARPHRIEIWFALDRGTLYLLSGGGESADWVMNIRGDRRVRIQIGTRRVAARARFPRSSSEDRKARELLDAKYMGVEAGEEALELGARIAAGRHRPRPLGSRVAVVGDASRPCSTSSSAPTRSRNSRATAG